MVAVKCYKFNESQIREQMTNSPNKQYCMICFKSIYGSYNDQI